MQLIHNCRVCSAGVMERVRGKNYSICNICRANEIHYVPLPHQQEFHSDNHTFKAIFGAYGSGKTTVATLSIIEHALTIPFGRTAMLAPTMKMLKETSYKELMKFLPHTMVEKEVRTKGEEKITLTNGHEILLLPSNNADKIRSLNLTAFYLEEASNSKYDVFVELTARLRNSSAFIYETDDEGNTLYELDRDGDEIPIILEKKLLGIICSNPDIGWIRTEILAKSDKVYANKKYLRDREFNPYMSTHLHGSHQNKYLDADFIPRMSRGRPDWWIKRYIYGSFDYAEGLVYADFQSHVVDPIPIPPNWKRLFGVDFGLRDPTVMLACAIDPNTGIAYIYDEHYEAEKPVHYHAEKMKKMLGEAPYGMMYRQPIADPSGNSRRGTNEKTYFSHYGEYGIYFQPGYNNIASGILKVFTYMSLGRLKIMSNCVNTLFEGREYKYEQEDLSRDKNRGENPKDANNHAMDVIRYIVSELPDDPLNVLSEVYLSDSENYEYRRSFKFPRAFERDEPVKEDWYYNY